MITKDYVKTAPLKVSSNITKELTDDLLRKQKQISKFSLFLLEVLGESFYLKVDDKPEIHYQPTLESVSKYFNKKITQEKWDELKVIFQEIIIAANPDKYGLALLKNNWAGGTIKSRKNLSTLEKFAKDYLENSSKEKIKEFKEKYLVEKNGSKKSQINIFTAEELEEIIQKLEDKKITLEQVSEFVLKKDFVLNELRKLYDEGYLPLKTPAPFERKNSAAFLFNYGKTPVLKYHKAKKIAQEKRDEKQEKFDALIEIVGQKDFDNFVEMNKEGLDLLKEFSVTKITIKHLFKEDKNHPNVVLLRELLKKDEYKNLVKITEKDPTKILTFLSQAYQIHQWLSDPRNGTANVHIFENVLNDVIYFQFANYHRFKMKSLEKGFQFVLSLEGKEYVLDTMSTGYLVDPKLEEKKNGYEITYTSGNSNREQLTGMIKSIGVKFKKNDLFIHVPINFPKIEITKQQKDYYWDLNSSRNKKIRTTPEQGTFLLSVDLNISPLGAYSILKIDDNGDIEIEGNKKAKIIETEQFGNILDEKLCGRINELKDKIYALKHVIKYHNSKKDERKYFKPEFLNNMISQSGVLTLDEDDKRANKNRIGLVMGEINKEYKLIKVKQMELDSVYRFENKCPSADKLRFCSLLDDYISLLSAYQHIDRKEKDDKCAAKFKRYRTRLRNDITTKLCSYIKTLAVKNDIKYVLVEKLAGPSKFEDKKDIKIWKLLSGRSTISSLNDLLENNGIMMVEIQPEHTSTTAPNGKGLRKSKYSPKLNKKYLYVPNEKGGITAYDSDEQAAKNIVIRGVQRYKNREFLKCQKIDDEKFLIVNDNESQYLQAFVKESSGKKYAVVSIKKGELVFDGINVSQYKKLRNKDEKFNNICYHNHEWKPYSEFINWCEKTYQGLLNGEIKPVFE